MIRRHWHVDAVHRGECGFTLRSRWRALVFVAFSLVDRLGVVAAHGVGPVCLNVRLICRARLDDQFHINLWRFGWRLSWGVDRYQQAGHDGH